MVNNKYKIFLLLMLNLISVGLLNYLAYAQVDNSRIAGMIIKDEKLLVPGMGGGGVLLGSTEKDVMMTRAKSAIKTKSANHDFFKDILKVECQLTLPFNYLYKYNEPECIIGFFNSTVEFIVVWDRRCILIEGVPISQGVMAVVYIYGNYGLACLREDNRSLYIYAEKGIALIDEDNNDTIDGVIIFKTGS
ncbi:MAG TPA: hypothetical protein PLH80_00435 [Spirochaetota bacterium]|nr:hypothetical protein [Spirochaetota bacterium]HOF13522.1 hypothetical protein [Spirochaetota bacterium]HOM87836.1 hypothetical protein [Spirochaetota bacterium]HPD06061.1 hypothetical protein [Spirochaetota bacterium]HQI37017.1 hypothetical protein [Spirochaetota bacterium]